jgi:uncharacterized protein (TIGR00159 family)
MWQEFGVKDLIDVLLVAACLYQIYKLMRASGSLNLFGGIIAFVALWLVVSRLLEMRLMGAIMDKIIGIGLIVLVVVFQEEIRRFLFALGSGRGWDLLSRIFSVKDKQKAEDAVATAIVQACMNLSQREMGALIVIQQRMDLKTYIRTGEVFNADVNAQLVENIFFKNSPLHDGAMIIVNGRIRGAACILPVAQKADLPKELGLRHRAGLGLALETDAIVIIVSEERGEISVAYNGDLKVNLSPEELRKLL